MTGQMRYHRTANRNAVLRLMIEQSRYRHSQGYWIMVATVELCVLVALLRLMLVFVGLHPIGICRQCSLNRLVWRHVTGIWRHLVWQYRRSLPAIELQLWRLPSFSHCIADVCGIQIRLSSSCVFFAIVPVLCRFGPGKLPDS